MFTWPENIVPLPSYNFDVDAEFSNIRSKMDSGRVRQRPRFTEELELASVKFDLTKKEYAVFKSIWVGCLNQGNDWFTMRLPVANGEDLTLVEVRFVSDYKATHRPFANWDISATLEFKESTNIGADITAVLISEGFDTNEFELQAENLLLEVGHFHDNHSFT